MGSGEIGKSIVGLPNQAGSVLAGEIWVGYLQMSEQETLQE